MKGFMVSDMLEPRKKVDKQLKTPKTVLHHKSNSRSALPHDEEPPSKKNKPPSTILPKKYSMFDMEYTRGVSLLKICWKFVVDLLISFWFSKHRNISSTCFMKTKSSRQKS